MAVTTRLEIFNADGSGLQTQPFDNNIPVNLTFNLADVREPDKRKASRSLTINIEASNEVNKCFENIFEVNIATQYFNKNKKTPVKYFVNEILNFEGSLQLIKIVVKPDKSIVYECSVIGAGGSLFVEIGEKLIRGNAVTSENLDFSAYDHTYNRATQISSRTNAGTGLSYVYPFVDRGTNGGSDTIFNVKDFFPCFHVYEYVKKIIEKAGYTFTSTILNSAEFKKYIVYPNIDKIELDQSQLDNRQFYVGLSSDLTVIANTNYYLNLLNETSPFFDVGNQVFGNYAKINYTGYYNIVASNKIEVTFNHTDTNVAYAIITNLQPNTIINKSIDNINYSNLTFNNTILQDSNNNSKFTINNNQSKEFSHEVATGEIILTANDYIRSNFFLNANYYIIDYYNNLNNLITPTGTLTLTYKLKSGVNKTSFYMLATKKEAFEGNAILVNNALPIKIKQKDFLKSIIQAFNLYVDLDPNNNKNLIIESFDAFYNTLPVKSYEGKTDLDKDQTINPNLLEGKRYIYSYKDDTDYWNDRYKKKWNETFGTHQTDVDNDFIKTDKKNELIFSPTPNIANYGLGIAHPRIYKEEGQGGSIIKKPFAQNIRLLVCGGVKTTINAYTYKEVNQTDLITNDYLYAGHTDDPFNPTIDLNFGLPKEVYYNYIGAYFTNNNLYNRYHAYYLKNLIDRDSRIETKYLWVNAKDINEFNFRNRVFVDGAYWIVNKIENYNPLSENSTKFELIKLLTADVFTPTSTPIFSDTAINAGADTLGQRLNNSLNVGNNIVNKGANSLAFGDNIFIPEGSNNVMIVGNDISLTNPIDNFTYINGQVSSTIIGQQGAIKLINNNYNVKRIDDTILIDATARNIAITLNFSSIDYIYNQISLEVGGTTFAVNKSKIITLKRMDNTANAIVVTAAGGATIDGAPNLPIVNQYDSYTLQFDGINWVILW